MFTLSDINTAHGKVKTGADFPQYVQDLISLGVLSYEVFVADGHTTYFGAKSYTVADSAKHTALTIAGRYASDDFVTALKAHQRGDTDYPRFLSDCANSGVHKWVMDLQKLTCSYYDIGGNEVWTERIAEGDR
ncbi:DUF1398 domain-containing protein [Sphingobacterium deserti]|uniref:Phage envelope protein n=1 Tax=Sphingobacterium deserti TaxID=1229276 RepID=A0A0B8T396_9SPHI|nr:DUF1398 family protein [Sphingobacterium deserti]KGE13478.1 hypothetical protein DI53_2763 [Sphingobacterium deserti]